eukprot:4826029-Pyramimonas_sp.AAC.1
MPSGTCALNSQSKIPNPGWSANWLVACTGPGAQPKVGNGSTLECGPEPASSDDDGLEWLTGVLKASMALKVKATLGPEDGDDKSVRILNRIASWTGD